MTSQVVQIARQLTGRICPVRAQRVKVNPVWLHQEVDPVWSHNNGSLQMKTTRSQIKSERSSRSTE